MQLVRFAEAEGGAAPVLQAAVDRFGWTVAGAGPVEVGQYVSGSLVPVLLGGGVHYLDQLTAAPVELEEPTIIEGRRVTHLYYRVRRAAAA